MSRKQVEFTVDQWAQKAGYSHRNGVLHHIRRKSLPKGVSARKVGRIYVISVDQSVADNPPQALHRRPRKAQS